MKLILYGHTKFEDYSVLQTRTVTLQKNKTEGHQRQRSPNNKIPTGPENSIRSSRSLLKSKEEVMSRLQMTFAISFIP